MLKIAYYYSSQTGKAPVRESIRRIKKTSTRYKLNSNIYYVAGRNGKAGNFVTKTIRGFKFSEIRVKISKDLYRILYFIWQDDYLVLLHMFVKKEGDKTPQNEFKKAKLYYDDFMENNNIYLE